MRTRTPFFNAPLRRPSDVRPIVILGVSIVLTIVAILVAPRSLALTATEPGPSVGAPPITVITTTSTSTTVPTTTTLGENTIVVIDDPRLGDLRDNPNADVLPPGYVSAAAFEIRRNISYGPDDIHKLDLYLPDVANAPVMVFLHSGGWIGGDRHYVPEMVLRFLEQGFAIASVEYRLAPEHPFPAPVHDVKRAVRHLKAMAVESPDLNGDEVLLYGTSAGGHLAAFTAATVGQFEPEDLTPEQAQHDSSVDGIIVVVGPTDLVEMYRWDNAWARPMSGAHAGCEPCTIEALELPSPIHYVHDDVPPAYWAYGDKDPLVDAQRQGRVIAEKWAATGAVSWFDLVEGAGHNLDETLVNQRAIEAFVDDVLGRI